MYKITGIVSLTWLLSFSLLTVLHAEESSGGQNPIYIPTAPSIRIVNPATNQIVGTIPVNFTFSLAFSPDAKIGYATQGEFGVQIIDLQTRQAIDSISGPWVPEELAVRPDGRQLALIDNNSRGAVFIGLPGKQVLATIPLGTEPKALAFHPNGRKLYVTDHDDVNPRVYVVDTQTFAISATIQTPNFPADVAVAPNGKIAYVVCEGTSDNSFVVEIDTETNLVVGTIPVLVGATDISIDKSGRFAYISTGGNGGGGILVLDLRTKKVVSKTITGDQTFGASVSEAGDFVYAINFNPPTTMIVMNTRTRQIVSSSALGAYSTHALTSLNPGPAIRPESCIVTHGPNRYTAYFGYQNNTGAPRAIPAGPDNSLSPPASSQIQPVYFREGSVAYAFRLEFDGSPITWAVNSPSGSTYWTTASRRSPPCR